MLTILAYKLFFILLFAPVFLQIVSGQDFSYSGNLGPKHWGERYSSCVGKHQSPIDISERNVNKVQLHPLKFKYFDESPEMAKLTNNGHTVAMTLKASLMPEISGGPLKGSYQFAQLHFHWGENDKVGSENTINNSSFPMELHMVFYKKSYQNFNEATRRPDGLTVLAFLYEISDENNKNYEILLDKLDHVKEPNMTTNISQPLHLNALLNQNRQQYFTYDGSLTTPPCSEVVTWIEFKQPIPLAHEQLELFRKLDSEQGRLTHNFRPTQPIYDRVILYNEDDIIDINDNEIEKSSANQMQLCITTFILVCLLRVIIVSDK